MDFAEAIRIAEESGDFGASGTLRRIEEDFDAGDVMVSAMIGGIRDLMQEVDVALVSQQPANTVEEIGDEDLLLFNIRTIATHIMFILREMYDEVVKALEDMIPEEGTDKREEVVSAIAELKAINIELREAFTRTLKKVLIGDLTVFPDVIERFLKVDQE